MKKKKHGETINGNRTWEGWRRKSMMMMKKEQGRTSALAAEEGEREEEGEEEEEEEEEGEEEGEEGEDISIRRGRRCGQKQHRSVDLKPGSEAASAAGRYVGGRPHMPTGGAPGCRARGCCGRLPSTAPQRRAILPGPFAPPSGTAGSTPAALCPDGAAAATVVSSVMGATAVHHQLRVQASSDEQ